MKFQFNSNQKYQLDAIFSVTNLFKGQQSSEEQFGISQGKVGSLLNSHFLSSGYISGYGNTLTLSTEQINKNLKETQDKNYISSSETIMSNGKNFSVEMETGTGKTYTYLRTIFELNKLYGFKKILIVVPSMIIFIMSLKWKNNLLWLWRICRI